MANPPFTNPAAPFWPLGKITVTTAGTPVPVNANVGTQNQGSAYATQFAKRIKQIIVYPLSTNTKPVYLVYKGYDHATNTNGVLMEVPIGLPQSLPQGALLNGAFATLDTLYLDSEANGEGAFITCIYG